MDIICPGYTSGREMSSLVLGVHSMGGAKERKNGFPGQMWVGPSAWQGIIHVLLPTSSPLDPRNGEKAQAFQGNGADGYQVRGAGVSQAGQGGLGTMGGALAGH